jgi:hypothetical protein
MCGQPRITSRATVVVWPFAERQVMGRVSKNSNFPVEKPFRFDTIGSGTAAVPIKKACSRSTPTDGSAKFRQTSPTVAPAGPAMIELGRVRDPLATRRPASGMMT